MNATKLNKSISAKKDTGECFTTKLKSTCKNSCTFEGKNFTRKSHLRPSCTKLFNSWCKPPVIYPLDTAIQDHFNMHAYKLSKTCPSSRSCLLHTKLISLSKA